MFLEHSYIHSNKKVLRFSFINLLLLTTSKLSNHISCWKYRFITLDSSHNTKKCFFEKWIAVVRVGGNLKEKHLKMLHREYSSSLQWTKGKKSIIIEIFILQTSFLLFDWLSLITFWKKLHNNYWNKSNIIISTQTL